METADERAKPIMGPAPHSEAWLNIRKYDPDRKDRPVVIGASQAAAACNLDPYSSPLQLYLEARGEYEREFDDDAKERMLMGLRLEPVILDCYADKMEVTVERGLPMYFHPKNKYVAATPDGLACPGIGLDEWCVDAKATNWRMVDASGQDENKFGRSGTDEVPMQYLCQAQVQMAVMGMDRCDFPVLSDGRQLLVYTVDRNEDLLNNILDSMTELGERIVNGDPPEPTWEHSGTAKALSRMFGCEVGKATLLGTEEQDMWQEYESLGRVIKNANERRDVIKNKLTWEMGDSQFGIFPSGKIRLKRISVGSSVYTEEDVREIQLKIGQTKRAGYKFIRAVKAE